jgi:hypothetical protein
MASLTGLSGMGTVTNEESTKDSGLFQQPMPATPSSSATLIDLFGASRTITIKGKFVVGDTGYASITLFIQDLDGLISGAQTSCTYTSDKTGLDYDGLVSSVTWTADEGAVNHVDYTIVFTEGSAI